MSYDIFNCYGLHKIKDSLTENFDYKDNDASKWTLVQKKDVTDSDGFLTEYSWYTDGTKHIFMFGDSDIYEPDEDYADWVAETEQEAKEWFDSYEGFTEDEISFNDIEDDFDDTPSGNANFLNDSFDRIYGAGLKLED